MTVHDTFPITLIFPPQAHATQPYLALPCLKAWLEANGFNDVELHDFSVESYEYFLSPAYLEKSLVLAAERLDLESFNASDKVPFEEMAAFRAAAETRVSARQVIARIEDAKAVLRGDGFFHAEHYLPASRTIYNALRIVSAAHFPTALTPHNFTMRHAIDRSEEVLAATQDEDENPYIAYFRSEVMPRLLTRKPRLVGLSVIYGSQLIPALTLGRMIKEELPHCHVTMGGGFLAYIGEKLMQAPGVDACLDSVVEHEGERPIEQLSTALRDGTSLAQVGSLFWFDRSGPEPRPVTNLRGHPVSLDEAPLPSFEGLPLDLYLSANVVLPYDINRGCYYGECTFCTLPTVIGPGFRTRKIDRMVDHLLALKEKYACSQFYFITDCLPPATLRELPRELLARDVGITWSCDAKVERRSYEDGGARLLYDSGCRKLLFGFESVTPRILEMMEKGQTCEDVTFVTDACYRAGISVTWYAMIGFPTETREEAEATLSFIEQHAGRLQEVSLQTFHIDEVAEIFRSPERFDITIYDDPEADLQLYHDYSVPTGMSQDETAQLHAEVRERLRACLPIFSGENILYFMQKSHYFLHLSAGMTPTEFSEACRQRERGRELRGPDAGLYVGEDLEFVTLRFSHSAARRTLRSRLAQATRPENQTGTFDAEAARVAACELPALEPKECVLVYSGEEAEFVELHPDGQRALEALRGAGELESLRDSIDTALPSGQEARARLDEFATRLHRVGVLKSPSGAREARSLDGCPPVGDPGPWSRGL
jgi:anaerobic magnesium-protoporphyrin IX monomethyl ester cyclase